MICPYCKKEFSNKVYKLHIERCQEKNKPKEKPVAKKGKDK